MSKRLGIKNFLKTSRVTLAKTFNRNVERVISSAKAEKSVIREDKILVRDEKKPSEIIRAGLDAAAEGIGSVPKTIINFCAPLAEHCNLRCRGCDHFAPIAGQEFADMNAFEKDFARLSYLVNGEAVKIGLMGGEPLLHPKVKDFLYIARRYFRQTKLRIVTNGVLLLKQNEDFWIACRENNIIVEVTKYPINLDFTDIRNVAGNYGVSLAFYDNTGDVQKTSNHLPLDINGGQDIRRNFTKCYHANNTIFLKKGRLYICTIAPNVHHFNKFFNVDMQTSDGDSIDIYEAQSAREIFQFLSKPIPFCRYCHVDKRSFGHPWKRSNKDIKEWIV